MREKREKVKIFLLGMIAASALLFTMGAGSGSGGIGRYQTTSAATSTFLGVYITDTRTGVTKTIIGDHVGQVGRPFTSMKNKPKTGPFD